MTINKRKKNSRQRGTMTHGWGAKKKHRGAGNRGGRGMAGTGKRADTRKPSIWDNPLYFGKHGFKKKNIKLKVNAINFGDLDQRMDRYVSEGKAKKKGDSYEIDLKDIGYNKILSSGKLSKKIIIKTLLASEKSVEKAKENNWQIILEKSEKKAAAKPQVKKAAEQ